MKEAAGEANLTVVAIVLIGIIGVVVTPIIRNMMATTEKQGCCAANGGVWKDGACEGASAVCSE